MKRISTVVACVLAFGACSIEPTPQQYIDRRDSLADQIAVSESELARRLEGLAGALRRRDPAEIQIALRPDTSFFVIGPVRGVSSPDELYRMFDDIGGGVTLEVQDLAVRVGGQNEVAWFRSSYHEIDAREPAFRFTGVFRRREGEWWLIEGHLSRPEAVAETQAAGGSITTPETPSGVE